MIKTFEAKGMLDRCPLEITAEQQSESEGFFSFLGRVLADEKSKRLFIADTNHHRICRVDLQNLQVAEITIK